MCKLKSGIILKDYIFIPDYNNHTNMLKELKIKDNKLNAKTLFVRAELFPVDGNIFSNILTWKFNVDQDILPNWFIYEYDKQRMFETVKEWVKDHIFENVDGLELKGKGKYYLKNCKNVKTYDSCEIIALGNCIINAHDNCIVYPYDDCIINAFNNCIVKAQNKCVVIARGNCKVRGYDNCIIFAREKCTIHAFNTVQLKCGDDCKAYIYDNCTVNAQDKCKVYYK